MTSDKKFRKKIKSILSHSKYTVRNTTYSSYILIRKLYYYNLNLKACIRFLYFW